MIYDLVKNNTVINSRDFETTPHTIASNKGVWFPRIIINPTHDSRLSIKTLVKSVGDNETIWEYVISSKDISEVRSNKHSELDRLSNDVETQGVLVGGVNIDTSRDSVSRVSDGLSYMGRSPNATIDFETKDGWAIADKAALELIQDVMFNHLHSTYSNKKFHYDIIADLVTSQEIIDYDISGGW